MPQDANASIEAVYRSDWSRIVAALIRVLGDFDVAEEAAQEAFAAAASQWPISGVPEFPKAWIIQTARHKAIDRLRRRTRFEEKAKSIVASGAVQTAEQPDHFSTEIPDDRLRLMFTCCHPALAPEAQVALTLRMLGGLETDEIARAFSFLHRRWHNDWSARSARSGKHVFHMLCRTRVRCRRGSMLYSQ